MPHQRQAAKASSARPAHFNDHVGVDCFTIPAADGRKLTFLNVVDRNSRFQVCARIVSRHPAGVMDTFVRVWASWAGYPKSMTLDQGGEFFREFADELEANDVSTTWCATQAPWQNGPTERHGGAWKIVAAKTFILHTL